MVLSMMEIFFVDTSTDRNLFPLMQQLDNRKEGIWNEFLQGLRRLYNQAHLKKGYIDMFYMFFLILE